MIPVVDAMILDLIEIEGGYVNDPNDSGGETKYGVTVDVARKHGYTGTMKDLPKGIAIEIYRDTYWVKPGFGKVAQIYTLVAHELFDTGVNMGVGKAAEFLQMALNALNRQGKDYPDIKEDGSIGPGTLRALSAYRARRGIEGEDVMLRALNCLQGAFYIDLSRRRGKDEEFVYGWLLNRVAI